MFERYTERARRVIFFARHEASQLGSRLIEPEHLLLGLIREGRGLTARLLGRGRVSADVLRRHIEERSARADVVPEEPAEVALSDGTLRTLAHAAHEADLLRHDQVGTEHLLLGIMREPGGLASRVLAESGLRLPAARAEVGQGSGTEGLRPQEGSLLATFGRDLSAAAGRGELDPLVGRVAELQRVIEILGRRTRSNPLLIGPPGVGKSAIVAGLASRMAAGDVPLDLARRRVVSLDMALLVAGTRYRGEFEERLTGILKELAERRDTVVFLDEVHSVVGAGAAEGSLDAAGVLKPALARGEIQCVGATTPAEFRRRIQVDRALERRFQPVRVQPPSDAEAVDILEGLRTRYEQHHGVRYADEAIGAAVARSVRYLPERSLPDKAIDLLDEAASHARLRDAPSARQVERRRVRLVVDPSEGADDAARLTAARWERRTASAVTVTASDVDEVVSRWTGIPVAEVGASETERLLALEGDLHKRVVSQREAVEAVARAVRRARVGFKDPGRPMGSFLFLGPTGVGKTLVARVVAEALFGGSGSLLRFDMSEYAEKHAMARLFGAPPGYVGHEAGGQLTEAVRGAPFSVVLLDEIEKAHPDVCSALLQVLEDGQLTDGLGTRVDFRHCLLVMTSNLGARLMERSGAMGFAPAETTWPVAAMREAVMGEVRRAFNPEFINRLDEIVLFTPLEEGELGQVVRLLLDELAGRLAERGVQVSIDEQGIGWLLASTAGERHFGARPLRRAVERLVADPLAEALLRGLVAPEERVHIGASGDGLVFTQSGRVVPIHDGPPR